MVSTAKTCEAEEVAREGEREGETEVQREGERERERDCHCPWYSRYRHVTPIR